MFLRAALGHTLANNVRRGPERTSPVPEERGTSIFFLSVSVNYFSGGRNQRYFVLDTHCYCGQSIFFIHA